LSAEGYSRVQNTPVPRGYQARVLL